MRWRGQVAAPQHSRACSSRVDEAHCPPRSPRRPAAGVVCSCAPRSWRQVQWCAWGLSPWHSTIGSPPAACLTAATGRVPVWIELRDGMPLERIVGCDVVVTLLDLNEGRTARVTVKRALRWVGDEGVQGDMQHNRDLGHHEKEEYGLGFMTDRYNSDKYRMFTLSPLTAYWSLRPEEEGMESGDNAGGSGVEGVGVLGFRLRWYMWVWEEVWYKDDEGDVFMNDGHRDDYNADQALKFFGEMVDQHREWF